jgi:hypothetical protein
MEMPTKPCESNDGWTEEDLEELQSILIETEEIQRRTVTRTARMVALAEKDIRQRREAQDTANRGRRRA